MGCGVNNMAIIYKAPENTFSHNDGSIVRIFLAGSIDMSKAENWQDRFQREFADSNVVICNPRRNDWDSSWVQSD